MAVAGRCWGWGRGRTLQRVVPTCRVESSALWVLTVVVAMPSSCLASVSSGCAPTAKAGRSQLNQRWTCYRNMMISKSNRGVRMGFRLRPRRGRRQTAATATVGGSMEPSPREPDMYGNQSVLLRMLSDLLVRAYEPGAKGTQLNPRAPLPMSRLCLPSAGVWCG